MAALPQNILQPWQIALKDAITDPQELLQLLELTIPNIKNTAFPLRVPRGFVSLMRKGDANDPLLRQILPVSEEQALTPGFSLDPLRESQANPLPGILHKYHGRVLLTLTGACATHCRYCFRQHFPYAENNPGSHGWDKALAYIANDTSIQEVILSGGDPLILPDKPLQSLCQRLAAIPHLKTLRIHSRLAIALPERINSAFISWFAAIPLRKVLVTHCNHAQEIGPIAKQAMLGLRNSQVTLLNQSVLLKGVNDSVTALIQLSETVFDAGILPYYLHLLDKVQGTAHFEVAELQAKSLMAGLLKSLPGYLVPRLVREQAGLTSKTLIPLTGHTVNEQITPILASEILV